MIPLLQNGSGLERSSPKQELRCLQGHGTENARRLILSLYVEQTLESATNDYKMKINPRIIRERQEIKIIPPEYEEGGVEIIYTASGHRKDRSRRWDLGMGWEDYGGYTFAEIESASQCEDPDLRLRTIRGIINNHIRGMMTSVKEVERNLNRAYCNTTLNF